MKWKIKLGILWLAIVTSNDCSGLFITTSYEKAVEIAKCYNKKICFLFNLPIEGRLIQESVDPIASRYVFVAVTPEHNMDVYAAALEKQGLFTMQNIALCDEEGEYIGSLEGSSSSSKEIVENIFTIEKRVAAVDSLLENQITLELALKEALDQMKEMQAVARIHRVIAAAIAVESGVDFALESYKLSYDPNIKEHILAKDPDNHLGSHFQLAILDYKHREKLDQENVMEPLEAFLKDPSASQEEITKILLIEAQYWMEHHQIEKAFQVVDAACELADESLKKDVEFTRSQLQILLQGEVLSNQ